MAASINLGGGAVTVNLPQFPFEQHPRDHLLSVPIPKPNFLQATHNMYVGRPATLANQPTAAAARSIYHFGSSPKLPFAYNVDPSRPSILSVRGYEGEPVCCGTRAGATTLLKLIPFFCVSSDYLLMAHRNARHVQFPLPTPRKNCNKINGCAARSYRRECVWWGAIGVVSFCAGSVFQKSFTPILLAFKSWLWRYKNTK